MLSTTIVFILVATPFLFHRIFSLGLGALPDLDLFGCALLYGQYNALVYHFCGSISVAALSDALRAEQDTQTGHFENSVCVAAIHRHESAAEFDVFEGEYSTGEYLYYCWSSIRLILLRLVASEACL